MLLLQMGSDTSPLWFFVLDVTRGGRIVRNCIRITHFLNDGKLDSCAMCWKMGADIPPMVFAVGVTRPVDALKIP